MDRPKLLVVEDEETIRKQMKWALNSEYEVILAEHRAMATERMRLDHPPLILLDLGLPPSPRTAEEGLRCLKELLRIDPGAKVVVVTGNQAKGNALKAIELGAFDYFLKPADFGEVKIVLKRALNIFRLERACQVQVAALSCNTELFIPPTEILEATNRLYKPGVRRRFGILEWPALLARLDAIDPSFRD